MSSKVWNKVANSGPLVADELPYFATINARKDGVQKFNISGGVLSTKSVWYIEGKHSPRTVLERWIEANENAVNKTGNYKIHHQVAINRPKFKDASKELLGPFESRGPKNPDGTTSMNCPFCGENINGLPDHLPCDG